VGAGALMIHVEKCLSRLRKSLSPATLANTQYAVALDWLSKQLKDGTLPLPFTNHNPQMVHTHQRLRILLIASVLVLMVLDIISEC